MSPDPYINQLLDQDLPCKAKPPVVCQVNTVLHARAEKRGLELCPFPSRAVLQHEIHELIITAEPAAPNKLVNRIAYVCFFEVLNSGMLWSGDQVEVNGKVIGALGGYEFSHMPNHMNLVIQAQDPLLTGFEMGLQPGDELRFVFVGKKQG
jgi:hypothetical protein